MATSTTPGELRQHGAPYPSQVAGVGGLPTVSVDAPASAVLLAIYLSFAATNMYIFQTNRRKGHKFLPSAMLFGFCMARVLTLVLRIAWACYPRSVSTAIAANILVNAGILIIYIVNVLFALRVLRALQPTVGWHPVLGVVLKILYAFIGCALILVIVLTVLSSYTLDPKVHTEALWIQRGAILYLFVFTLIPAALLAVAVLLPRHSGADTFGHGSMKTKIIVLALGCCCAITIAGFKAGMTWETPRAVDNPAWYHSRAAFYCFNFMLEIFVLGLYVPARVDKRFHVPDGSSKRKTFMEAEKLGEEGHSDAFEKR